MPKQKRYSDDFKRNAIQYVEDHPDMILQHVADRLGVPSGTLHGWIRKYRRQLTDENADPRAPLTEAEKDNIRLRRENRELQDAVEILKKAISILND